MKKRKEVNPSYQMCARCGVNRRTARVNYMLGICSVYGKSYKRHLWIEQDYKPFRG